MIRNLKALGLTLVAMLSLGAVLASAASAQNQQGEVTSDGKVTLHIIEEEGKLNQLSAFEDTVECPGSTYTGHNVLTHEQTTLGTKHTFLPKEFTTVTVTPHYKQETCETGSGLPATVETTGCDFVFHIGKTTPANNTDKTYGVTADVECPPNAEIHVTAFSSDSHALRLCSETVGSQTGLTGAHVTDLGNGTLRVSGEFTGIHVNKSGLCGNGTTNTATFAINALVSGKNEAGGATGLSISEVAG